MRARIERTSSEITSAFGHTLWSLIHGFSYRTNHNQPRPWITILHAKLKANTFLCPMLDAHDALHPQRDLLLDFSDNDELNLWADSQMEAPVTARPIDITDERWDVHGNEDAPLFSTVNLTYSPSGLRNRRAGSRRHTPTSSDSLSSHPLQGGSHSASSSVTLDDSITRPSLRRWLSGGGYDEDVGDDPSTDNETVRTSETLVIVHEVSCNRDPRSAYSLVGHSSTGLSYGFISWGCS